MRRARKGTNRLRCSKPGCGPLSRCVAPGSHLTCPSLRDRTLEVGILISLPLQGGSEPCDPKQGNRCNSPPSGPCLDWGAQGRAQALDPQKSGSKSGLCPFAHSQPLPPTSRCLRPHPQEISVPSSKMQLKSCLFWGGLPNSLSLSLSSSSRETQKTTSTIGAVPRARCSSQDG